MDILVSTTTTTTTNISTICPGGTKAMRDTAAFIYFIIMSDFKVRAVVFIRDYFIGSLF